MTHVDQFSPETYAARLAEGPHWWSGHGLLWVDIPARAVFLQAADRASPRHWQLPDKVSAAIPTEDGFQLIVPGQGRLFSLNPLTGQASVLATLPGEAAGNRCNDAKCDPLGNLWVGTMDDAEQAFTGSLWCLTSAGVLVRVLRNIGVPNTLAWDSARSRMYFGDSRRGTIFVFDWTAHEGVPELGDPCVFVSENAAPGVPDGSAIDGAGCLLNARWDGGQILRISPEGHVVESLPVPAARVTSCCFGGPDFTELFVTTAAGDDSDPLDLGGRVFVVRGAPGGPAVPGWSGRSATGEVVDISQEMTQE